MEAEDLDVVFDLAKTNREHTSKMVKVAMDYTTDMSRLNRSYIAFISMFMVVLFAACAIYVTIQSGTLEKRINALEAAALIAPTTRP